MEREQFLTEWSVKFLYDRFQDRLGEIQSCSGEKEAEIRKALILTAAEGVQRCKENKKNVKYVILTILESSILTKSYEFMIAFYDETIYLDRDPVYVYWCPDDLFSGIERDFEQLMESLRGRVIRLMESETMVIRRNYVLNYIYLAVELFRSSIPQILAMMKEQNLEMDEGFVIAMGRLMERPALLYGKEVEAG